MKAEIAKKWVEALRSGKYAQGSRQLISTAQEGKQFCCLGVLCDLYLRETPSAPERWNYDGETFLDYDGDAEYELLPAAVQEWAGIHDEVGTLPPSCDISANTLVECNDERGMNFNQIADIIEQHAEEL